MSKLDWSRITDKVAVWCKTEKEAKAFLLAAEETGRRWASRDRLSSKTEWGWDEAETCYALEEGRGVVHGRRTRLESNGYTIIPYADLLLPEKPRICEVLGVEVEERFKVESCSESEFWVEDGALQCKVEFPFSWDQDTANFISVLLDAPDFIIRQPRFTEDEVAFLRYIEGGYRGTIVSRTNDGILEMRFPEDGLWALPMRLLPSILPGQSVAIADIIGEATP